MNILEKLKDLHEQATSEHSHFYVASCCKEAIAEISSLKATIGVLEPGEHPDEIKPRSASFMQERKSWAGQVKRQQEYTTRLEEKALKLRKALVGVVGAEDPAELRGMEGIIRAAAIPDEDKASTINAIHVLLETHLP